MDPSHALCGHCVVLLFGQVRGPGHLGKPREIWHDLVLSEIDRLSISRSIKLLRISLPGKLSLAPHASDPGWLAFQLLIVLEFCRPSWTLSV